MVPAPWLLSSMEIWVAMVNGEARKEKRKDKKNMNWIERNNNFAKKGEELIILWAWKVEIGWKKESEKLYSNN